jgi:hypothetical protein
MVECSEQWIVDSEQRLEKSIETDGKWKMEWGKIEDKDARTTHVFNSIEHSMGFEIVRC